LNGPSTDQRAVVAVLDRARGLGAEQLGAALEDLGVLLNHS
jgi:hypothetical protein